MNRISFRKRFRVRFNWLHAESMCHPKFVIKTIDALFAAGLFASLIVNAIADLPEWVKMNRPNIDDAAASQHSVNEALYLVLSGQITLFYTSYAVSLYADFIIYVTQ